MLVSKAWMFQQGRLLGDFVCDCIRTFRSDP
jgi:hypothetical protein